MGDGAVPPAWRLGPPSRDHRRRSGFRIQGGVARGERREMRKASALELRPASRAGKTGVLPLPVPIPHFSEAELVHLWEGQRFPPEALRTTAGAPLRAVY